MRAHIGSKMKYTECCQMRYLLVQATYFIPAQCYVSQKHCTFLTDYNCKNSACTSPLQCLSSYKSNRNVSRAKLFCAKKRKHIVQKKSLFKNRLIFSSMFIIRGSMECKQVFLRHSGNFHQPSIDLVPTIFSFEFFPLKKKRNDFTCENANH